MKELFGGSDLVGLASIVTIAFFCFFVFICCRMLRKGPADRFDHVASLPLEDSDRVIVRKEKGATR
ncbi:MAG: CcoQ/FixQ family Cbb3-type cytochrome c oxidase assembly chaperone [Planctomycetota bacterium]